ncbi:MAG: signal peptidase II [bacterium]|nr:signal peptidase II [bacterium]
MLPSHKVTWLHSGLVAGVAIAIDQITKAQVAAVTLNPGIGLGLAASFVSQQLLVIVTITMLVVLWFAVRSWWEHSRIATGLFFGGALSNVLDRVFFGGVRDWLVVPVLGIQNNLADWAIFLGIAWLVRSSLFAAVKGGE